MRSRNRACFPSGYGRACPRSTFAPGTGALCQAVREVQGSTARHGGRARGQAGCWFGLGRASETRHACVRGDDDHRHQIKCSEDGDTLQRGLEHPKIKCTSYFMLGRSPERRTQHAGMRRLHIVAERVRTLGDDPCRISGACLRFPPSARYMTDSDRCIALTSCKTRGQTVLCKHRQASHPCSITESELRQDFPQNKKKQKRDKKHDFSESGR